MTGLRAVAATVALVAVAAGSGSAAAQWGQVRITGSIDSEASYERLQVGAQSFQTLSFGSRYAPNVDGFLLDPRLLSFSYNGAFADRRTIASEGDSDSLSIQPYRVTVSVLPFSPHSLSLRASRLTSDFDFEQGRLSTATDTYGGEYRYRGGVVLPEVIVGIEREKTEERLLTGATERRTRSTLTINLHKQYDRFRPTLNYTAEQTDVEGDAIGAGLQTEGLKHRVRYDDRIRLGERAVLTPVLEYTMEPDGQEASGLLTLSGLLSPTLDGSTTMRYSFFDRSGVATHTTAADGQLTKRFTESLVLTTVGNAVFVTGDGTSAWGAGGVVALRAAPFRHLRGVVDYGLQLSTSDQTTTVSHRGHVNAVSTVIPRHTISADYFLSTTDTGVADGRFSSHTGTLSVLSEVIPLTLLGAEASEELQQGGGDRERRWLRLTADVRPQPWLAARVSGEYLSEHAAGGGRARLDEKGVVGRAALTARPWGWLEGELTGFYGVRDVHREDRTGAFNVYGGTATLTVARGPLYFRGEGFLEYELDVPRERRGGRASLSYRFRVWTITADAELVDQSLQGTSTLHQRVNLRVSRPLNFTLP